MLITNGEPDTPRGVSPVPREGVGNLLAFGQQGAFALPYDMFRSQEIQNILDTTNFIMMLNQAGDDARILGEHLRLSEEEMEYIQTGEVGKGLLWVERITVPFVPFWWSG